MSLGGPIVCKNDRWWVVGVTATTQFLPNVMLVLPFKTPEIYVISFVSANINAYERAGLGVFFSCSWPFYCFSDKEKNASTTARL